MYYMHMLLRAKYSKENTVRCPLAFVTKGTCLECLARMCLCLAARLVFLRKVFWQHCAKSKRFDLKCVYSARSTFAVVQ